MPKPVPIPVRRKIWERSAQGESAASLALAFGLSVRTVRHLAKRARERGNSGLLPGYRAPSTFDHAHPDEVRRAVLALRRDHPSWGADLIRVMLAADRPEVAWPAPQTIRRWLRDVDLGPAPVGRRPGSSSGYVRASRPHQTWQIDASEHIPIADKSEVCWLRVVDEATGSVLGTDVFPPRVLDPGRSARGPGVPQAGVPEVGLSRATAGR